MKFILYLIFSVGELFGVMVGVPSTDQVMSSIGLVVLAVIGAIYALIVFIFLKLNKKGLVAAVLSIVILIAVIAVFCGVCILIEYLTGKPIMK